MSAAFELDFMTSKQTFDPKFESVQLIGMGICSAQISPSGELVVNFTDGHSENIGHVVGSNGVGIVSISKTKGNGAPGTSDTYTIKLSDGSAYDFAVYQGADGKGDKTFTFNQAVPEKVWTVLHSMGKYPSVSVSDSAGTVVFGEVSYTDVNSIKIVFASAFAGTAYLN
ncbi:MAG: hypothetical protein RR235_04985 [Oscillospiraceae bacterium]